VAPVPQELDLSAEVQRSCLGSYDPFSYQFSNRTIGYPMKERILVLDCQLIAEKYACVVRFEKRFQPFMSGNEVLVWSSCRRLVI